jgi:hypothetical protein
MASRSVHASTVRLYQLGEVAAVLAGLSTGGRVEHDPTGSHQVVLSRHLVAGLPYTYADRDAFRIHPGRNATKYEIRQGDVLFMSRGVRNVASWIDAVPNPSVAPVSFYIIRSSAALDPGYLTWFLNQRSAQRAIADIRTGAGTPIVQRAPFAELEIPVPDLQTQRTVAAIVVAMVREEWTLQRLSEATGRAHELTSEQIARDLVARAENNDAD